MNYSATLENNLFCEPADVDIAVND
jgi:hypothetical protein